MVYQLGRQEASTMFPQEYHNLVETFEHGEAVLHVQHDILQADELYQLALQKGAVLQAALKQRKDQLAEQERQIAAETVARLEEERLLRKAAEVEAMLREQERKAEEAAKAVKPVVVPKEVPVLVPSYTVHRGETLPQIAARSEVYNDASLWPLIYQANRDQIRDPRQLWPGQVLKIPRHLSRDRILDAKRYSKKSGSASYYP